MSGLAGPWERIEFGLEMDSSGIGIGLGKSNPMGGYDRLFLERSGEDVENINHIV